MYSNLTLYYLDQMGITPWVKKESSAFAQAAEHSPVKLMILLADEPRGKAQSLFKQMLAYINMADDDLRIIKLSEETNLSAQLEKHHPQTLLSFGQNTTGLNLTCPVQESVSLDYLLSHPLSKKDILQKITTLKAFV